MRNLVIATLLSVLPVYASGSHHMRGYVTKCGAYVAPSHATNPDHTRLNNWSHKGNINPYTGKRGSKR